MITFVIIVLESMFPGRINASESSEQIAGKAVEQSGYAEVNGLRMYYEIHGGKHCGTPLVLLHGSFMDTESSFGKLLPELVRHRPVIAIEQQGHGRAADIDRPLSYEQMADDTAELLQQLGAAKADFFGWSMGGNIATQVAIRHPEVVNKVAVTGSFFGPIQTAFTEEGYKGFTAIPDDFAPPVLKDAYDKLSPKPERWPAVVSKVRQMGLAYKGLSDDQLRGIQAPFMIMTGDQDTVDLVHLVDTYKKLPNGALAIVPNSDHFLPVLGYEQVLQLLEHFLDHGSDP
ncbi:alpha/beta hydrolase [Paenibacillus ehimensis]|uniref:alpha/beta fold hydrolase n=1 Tax=Paenibacillus ehimensis TaxID=79264 RepID=UPI002DBFB61E|nr:alpha/beta hydrolase [Paenibacillus ehimensis]MEC0211606.1 alpha/beta hydrolase [Paenibacillus ehimensis]